jgi:hypothetical protein
MSGLAETGKFTVCNRARIDATLFPASEIFDSGARGNGAKILDSCGLPKLFM